MKTVLKAVCLLSACLAATAAWAQEYRVPPDPWSEQVLEIHQDSFQLNTVNRVGNICKLEGRLQGKGRQRFYEDGQGCRVAFVFGSRSVAVKIADASHQACREYCGHNAWLEGDYQRLPAACSHKAEQQVAQRFQAAYHARRFSEAIRIRNGWLQQCGDFAHGLTQLHARNDLAVAYKNVGDKVACRQVLQPWQAEIEDSAEARHPGPVFAEEYARALKAARFNWRACR